MNMKHWFALPIVLSLTALAWNGAAQVPPAPIPAPAVIPAPPPTPDTGAPAGAAPIIPGVTAPAIPVPPPGDTPAPAAALPVTPPPVPTHPPTSQGDVTVKQSNVNVRGQARINSEVVARLNKGDRVTVLGQVKLASPKVDEPAQWTKIALPSTAKVWVNASFIDPATRTVKGTRLNVRSGPGENYSVLGTIAKGAPVKELETKGTWTRIEPTPGLYAFVAAHLLDQSGVQAPTLASNSTPKPSTPKPATDAAPSANVSTQTVAAAKPPTDVAAAVPADNAAPLIAPPADTTTPTPAEPEQPSRRVVTREGIVERSVSIQAPTYFVLENKDSRKTINYLFSPPSNNIVLRDYQGQRILVTGEEMLDERWPNTPVITVETVRTMP